MIQDKVFSMGNVISLAGKPPVFLPNDFIITYCNKKDEKGLQTAKKIYGLFPESIRNHPELKAHPNMGFDILDKNGGVARARFFICPCAFSNLLIV